MKQFFASPLRIWFFVCSYVCFFVFFVKRCVVHRKWNHHLDTLTLGRSLENIYAGLFVTILNWHGMVNITYCAFCVLCLCVVLWKLTYIFWKLPRELLSRFLISGQSVQDQNISRNLTRKQRWICKVDVYHEEMCLLCVIHFQIISYPTKTAVLWPLCPLWTC